MGARQSRRSVDITTTPKRGESESPIEGEGKVEKISDLETKIATNGSIHNEIEYADKEETEKEEAESAIKENGVSDSEGSKTPDADVSIGDQLNELGDVGEKSPDSVAEKSDDTNENNKKNKEKSKKKKWSFRSISFSRKDKSKPAKDEKNGEVKEVNEEGAEEAVATTTPTSPEGNIVDKPTSPSDKVAESEPIANGESGPTDGTAPKVEEVPKATDILTSKSEEQPASVEPNVTEVKKEEPSTIIEEPTLIKEESKVEESRNEVEEPKVEVVNQSIKEEIKADENLVAESKEVRNEEVPPPLPSSNPPSPVTVFAESTMADAPSTDHVPITQSTSPSVESDIAHPDDTPEILPSISHTRESENISSKGDCPESTDESSPAPTLECVSQSVPEQVSESQAQSVSESLPELPEAPKPEHVIEPVKEILTETSPKVLADSPQAPIKELVAESCPISPSLPLEPVSPTKESEPEPLPTPIEQVINTDSLPDISTESLPSLPEPLSESLPEPMSLPPVDCIPEPIALEAVSNSLAESEPIPHTPIESEKILESIADIPPPNSEAILTNGDAHDLSSVVDGDTALATAHEGPVKQVIATSEVLDGTEEKRHESQEATAAPVPTAAEE